MSFSEKPLLKIRIEVEEDNVAFAHKHMVLVWFRLTNRWNDSCLVYELLIFCLTDSTQLPDK